MDLRARRYDFPETTGQGDAPALPSIAFHLTPEGARIGGIDPEKLPDAYRPDPSHPRRRVVRNAGRAPATAFWLRVVDDTTGGDMSGEVGGRDVIAPDDPPVKPAAVEVMSSRLRPKSHLTVWVRWIDEEGQHDQPTDVHPRYTTE